MWNRQKIGIICGLFVLWMIIQLIRAPFGGEPYPAIMFPGFTGNGKTALISRELYLLESGEVRLITHYESVYGHTRYLKLLDDFCKAVDEDDNKELILLKAGLIDIRGLEATDTLEIIERKWKATKDGYDVKSSKIRRFIL